jgi:CoA:oxalate CoA-transferase
MHRLENDTSEFAWTTRMHLHAIAGRPPLRYGPYIPAMQVGGTAAAAGIAAVWSLEHGGERRDIEISAIEALSGNVDTYFTVWSFSQAEMPRQGGQSKAAYPAGNYRCKDGYVMFAAAGDRFFQRLCEGIGHPELITDPRFANPLEKPLHWADFMTYLEPWLMARTRQEVFTELQTYGVMVAPMLEIPDVEHDPQAVARGSFVEVEQPGVGSMKLAGPPFRLDDAWVAKPAPALGEHTVDLLDAAGYTRDEQAALFRAAVIG